MTPSHHQDGRSLCSVPVRQCPNASPLTAGHMLSNTQSSGSNFTSKPSCHLMRSPAYATEIWRARSTAPVTAMGTISMIKSVITTNHTVMSSYCQTWRRWYQWVQLHTLVSCPPGKQEMQFSICFTTCLTYQKHTCGLKLQVIYNSLLTQSTDLFYTLLILIKSTS